MNQIWYTFKHFTQTFVIWDIITNKEVPNTGEKKMQGFNLDNGNYMSQPNYISTNFRRRRVEESKIAWHF